jgi:ribokinase
VRVTVVGSLNEDVMATVDRLPERGETVIASAVSTAPGGKGANQAAAAATLGARVHMVGRVGDDAPGSRMLVALASAGVDVRNVLRTPSEPTGTATIPVERSSGENLILVVPGANSALLPEDVDLTCLREADVVLLQLEVPMHTVIAAASLAGGRVVLNPAPSQPLPQRLLESVDLIVPNEHELVRVSGVPAGGGSLVELVHHAQALRGRCREGASVVVTLGARGALAVTGDAPAVVQGPPPVDAVDATGAGDCFCGALGASLADGAEILDAVGWAVAAASVSTTGTGARSALPGPESVAAALSRLPPPTPVL